MQGDHLLFRIEAPRRERDRLAGELFELGTLGIEERSGEGLLAYFTPGPGTERAVLALADPVRGIRVSPATRIPPRDWEQLWREGLAARRVAGLWIRPSWVPSEGTPEIQIDPAQAFGSGEHATTRLALELLLRGLEKGDRVLDFGTGSGILALAALRSGAGSAVGIDVDRVACENAASNARLNALAPAWVCGSLDGIARQARFDVAVANLLWSRLRPWLPRLVGHAKRGLVLSGYLHAERSSVERALGELGLEMLEERQESQSGDVWCASRVAQPPAR